MTRDDLVAALRPHAFEIVEAEEWRPLADHVMALIDRAVAEEREAHKPLVEAARVVCGLRHSVVVDPMVSRPTWDQWCEAHDALAAAIRARGK